MGQILLENGSDPQVLFFKRAKSNKKDLFQIRKFDKEIYLRPLANYICKQNYDIFWLRGPQKFASWAVGCPPLVYKIRKNEEKTIFSGLSGNVKKKSVNFVETCRKSGESQE